MKQEDRLLTNEELDKIDEEYFEQCFINPCKNSPSYPIPFIDTEKFVKLTKEARLKVQDAKSIKLRDKEWVEEIEECQIKPNCFSRDLYTEGTVIMGKNQWQSLKSKMGVEVELA